MYNSYLNDLNDDENYQSFLFKIPLDDDYKPNLIIDNEKINNKIENENGNGNKEIKIECIKTEQSSNQRKEEVILDVKKGKKRKWKRSK